MAPDELHGCRSATARQKNPHLALQKWALVPMAVLCASSGGLLFGLWMTSAALQVDRTGWSASSSSPSTVAAFVGIGFYATRALTRGGGQISV